jgi:chorismate synthase
VPRPGHGDLTYLKKYGIKASSGGGRSSARETVGRVIAGALAKQYLKTYNIGFSSWVYSVGNNSIPD